MANTISDFGGTSRKLLRWPEPEDKMWSAFNPSIGYAETPGYAILFRSSNYIINDETGWIQVLQGAVIKSRLWFSELDEDLQITGLREIQFDHGGLEVYRGVEDARLFWRDDSWHFTAVMLERGHTPRARMCVYRLNSEATLATLVEKLETPYPERPEKNWMAPDIPTDAFDYIYSFRQTYTSGRLVDLDNSSRLPRFRGGSGLVLQSDGTYLAVVHEVDIKESRKYNPLTFAHETRTVRNYTHRIAQYDPSGRLLAATDPFIFNEPGIEYAAGLVEHGDNLAISYGRHDAVSYLSLVPKAEVVRNLKPIVDITQP